MQVAQIVAINLQKKQLLQKRDQMIENQRKRRNRIKINQDCSAAKRGVIEKIKFIRKQKFQKVQYKPKKTLVAVEDNITAQSFLMDSANYRKFLCKTKEIVKFQSNMLSQSIRLLYEYAQKQHQQIINVQIKLQKDANCSVRPVQMYKCIFYRLLPYVYQNKKIFLVINNFKESEYQQLSKIQDINIQILNFHDFTQKIKNKQITSQLIQNKSIFFFQFSLFKRKQFLANYLKKGITLFPLQLKKVPFHLQSSYNSFRSYFEDMISYHYFLLNSSQLQQIFHYAVPYDQLDYKIKISRNKTQNKQYGKWSPTFSLAAKTKATIQNLSKFQQNHQFPFKSIQLDSLLHNKLLYFSTPHKFSIFRHDLNFPYFFFDSPSLLHQIPPHMNFTPLWISPNILLQVNMCCITYITPTLTLRKVYGVLMLRNSSHLTLESVILHTFKLIESILRQLFEYLNITQYRI